MKLLPRKIVNSIEKWMDTPEIIALLGARQVGKTSIIKLLMQRLHSEEYLYFDLEDTYNLQILSRVDTFLDYIKTKGFDKSKRVYVFIDEIQNLPQATKFLKIVHDHYSHIKLIVSGSSSFEIRKKFGDALTGRKVIFTIYPLSFEEYLWFRNSEYSDIKKEITLKKVINNFGKIKKYNLLTPKILPLMEDFIIFGGYPLPTLSQDKEQRIIRLKEIHNTYIQKDIKDLAKIETLLQFNQLVSYLSVQIGGLLNLTTTSKELGITRRHIEKFIFLLEKTFVLNLLKPFFVNKKKELVKMPKVYFNDTGLRNINIGDVRSLEFRQDRGALAENCFFQEILKRKEPLEEFCYWRTKDRHEVDFIIMKDGSLLPAEIKYQRFKETEISSSMRAFIDKFSPVQAVVITKDLMHRTRFHKTEIFFIPLWMV